MTPQQVRASESLEPSTQEPAFPLVMEFAAPFVLFRTNRR